MKTRLRSQFAIFLATALCAVSLHAAVVRPAPDFSWDGIRGASSLRAVRGQPVVLLMAPNPRSGAFKKQAKEIRKIYEQFAARGVVFAVAFQEADEKIPTDIPFAVVTNGAQVASNYGPEKPFAIAIIGKDGNLDYMTSQVIPASRVRDVIQNSFEIQAPAR